MRRNATFTTLQRPIRAAFRSPTGAVLIPRYTVAQPERSPGLRGGAVSGYFVKALPAVAGYFAPQGESTSFSAESAAIV